MSRINKFKSVVSSTIGIISSRNFDYMGYWFPGFLSKPNCDYHFDLINGLPSDKIQQDFVTEINRIIKKQILLNDLGSYKVKTATFDFKNSDDKIYTYYCRNCKRIDLKLKIETETGRIYESTGNLYADKHDPEKEFQRRI